MAGYCDIEQLPALLCELRIAMTPKIKNLFSHTVNSVISVKKE